ncbi:MAG TPA: chemotaxis protein CheB [Hyphomicrobiaceae bacterium]|nr:chemotaxis protein CheB [Hyphomicrobiaceae bacterium]
MAIGASAGGVEALQTIARGLPRDLDAAVAIVLHISPSGPGHLPSILARAGALPAEHARHNQPIRRGRIYVAPPDCHMLLHKSGFIRLSQGAKENGVRPAADPLFRSAAVSCGSRAIGVVLTGALDDGTAGLAAIKGCGGIAVVQDPASARMSSMPESALRHVLVDHCIPLHEMAPCIVQLVAKDPPKSERGYGAMRANLDEELRLLDGEGDVTRLGEPSLFTCPECQGMLIRVRDPDVLRFRCHTGHAFSAASLQAAQREAKDKSLWSALRAVQENAMLIRKIADHEKGRNGVLGEELSRHADDAERLAHELRRLRSDPPRRPSAAPPDREKGS